MALKSSGQNQGGLAYQWLLAIDTIYSFLRQR